MLLVLALIYVQLLYIVEKKSVSSAYDSDLYILQALMN